MDGLSRGLRVQVFIGESAHDGRAPLYQALVEHLRKEGAAGVTVVRGMAGFGAASRIHTAALLDVSGDLPLILTWIDSPERVEKLLPGIRERVHGALITVDEVHVASYERRRVDQLRFDIPVRDAMSRPVQLVHEEVSARTAAEILVGRGYRSLPVVDEAGRPVGIISNADLVTRAGMPARLRILEGLDAERRRALLDAMPTQSVAAVMTGDVVTIADGASLADATRLMTDRKLKRLPVVDGDGRLVGIISRADVLRAVAESFPREGADALGSGLVATSSGDAGASNAGAADPEGDSAARTAGEIMRADAPVVDADAPLQAVLDAVASTSLNRALVTEKGGRLLGTIADADILGAVDSASHPSVLEAIMRRARAPEADGPRARELAVETPVVGPGTPLGEVARAILEHHLRMIPVVDGEGRLLGIVGRASLLQASRAALDALEGESAKAGFGADEEGF